MGSCMGRNALIYATFAHCSSASGSGITGLLDRSVAALKKTKKKKHLNYYGAPYRLQSYSRNSSIAQ